MLDFVFKREMKKNLEGMIEILETLVLIYKLVGSFDVST